MQYRILSACSVVALAAAAASPAWAQTGPSQTADESVPELAEGDSATEEATSAEIIVTANRREQRLQDVPASISALTSEKIENLGITDVADYAALVPGFAYRTSGAPGTGAVILRGLNTGNYQTNATAAYYIDDTPFTASGLLSYGGILTPDPDLSDLERIEVLKGPQGTLYGASSLGGLVRLISKKPDLDTFSGSLRVDVSDVDGGQMGYGGRASLNVPLVTDTVGLRVTGTARHIPGYTDNLLTGTENVNQGESYGARASLLVRATPDLDIEVGGLYQSTKTTGLNATLAVTDTLTPRFDRFEYRSFFDTGVDLEYYTTNLSVRYGTSLGDFALNGSYGHYDVAIYTDYTNAYNVLLPFPSALPGFASPSMDKYNAEARFASRRIGPVEFIAGLFYTKEDTAYPVDLQVFDPTTRERLPAPYSSLVRNETEGTFEEYAGYTNVTVYLADEFDVTGGIRYSKNDQRYQSRPGINVFVPTPGRTIEDEDSATTYVASARWRPTDNLTAYVRAASGYRPGGPANTSNPTLPQSVDPDTVWSYEAGVKASTADRRFSADLAAYRTDWTNIQLNSLVNGLLALLNAGKAKVEGIELELNARPVDGLVLGASAAHTSAKLTEIDAGVTAAIGAVEGDRLPLTPKFAGALLADYTFSVGGTEMSVGATAKHTGERISSFPGSTNNPGQELPSFTSFDLRTSAVLGEFNVQLRADNIFNSHGIQTATSLKVLPGQAGTDTLLYYIQPRTITLSVGYNF